MLHAETDAENRRIDALTNRAKPTASDGDDNAIPRLKLAGDPVALILPGIGMRQMLSGDEAAGRWSFLELSLAPGVALPPHHFASIDAYWFAVAGEVEVTIGALTRAVPVGGFGYAPAETTQAVRNVGTGSARLYVGYSPAGPELGFAAAQALARGGAVESASADAVLERHGFRFTRGVAASNDHLTNCPAQRLQADVDTFDDFLALRRAWSAQPALPRLVDGAGVHAEFDMSGIRSRPLLTGDESGGRAYVRRAVVSPGYSARPHHQPTEEEVFYVLDGAVTLTIGSETRVVDAGGFGFAPRNATHGFSNHSDAPARLLIINSPAGHERGFEAMLNTDRPDRIPDLMAVHGWRVHPA